MKKTRGESGFTLLEMMVAIAIIGISSAIAAPALSGWVPHYQLKSSVIDVASMMKRARGMAIAQNENVGVAFGVPTASDYSIFIDQDGDSTYTAGEPIRMTGTLPETITFGASAGVDDIYGGSPPAGGVDFDTSTAVFAPDGGSIDDTGAASGGEVYLSSQDLEDFAIVLTPVGGFRTAQWGAPSTGWSY